MIGEGRTGDHTIYRARATAKARGLERFRDQSDISLCALRLRSQRAASDHFPSLSSPSFSPFDTFPTLAGRCIISISAASSFTPILPRRYSPLINLTDETRMKYEKKKINDSPLYQRFFPRSVSSSFFLPSDANRFSQRRLSRRIFESNVFNAGRSIQRKRE